MTLLYWAVYSEFGKTEVNYINIVRFIFPLLLLFLIIITIFVFWNIQNDPNDNSTNDKRKQYIVYHFMVVIVVTIIMLYYAIIKWINIIKLKNSNDKTGVKYDYIKVSFIVFLVTCLSLSFCIKNISLSNLLTSSYAQILILSCIFLVLFIYLVYQCIFGTFQNDILASNFLHKFNNLF